MADNEKSIPHKIEWTAPEYLHYPKSFWWYFGTGLITILLVGYFVFTREFLTATLFLVLAVLLFFFARKSPRNLDIILGPAGVKINSFQIPYQQIKAFWMVYDPPEIKTLNFETTATLNRFLTLQLGSQDPVQIRRFLLEFLAEDLERGEHLTDRLSRALKF